MAQCPACEKLEGAKSSTEPHADLLLLETKPSLAGHNGYSERYRCSVCATPWTRDIYKRDTGALWEQGRV